MKKGDERGLEQRSKGQQAVLIWGDQILNPIEDGNNSLINAANKTVTTPRIPPELFSPVPLFYWTKEDITLLRAFATSSPHILQNVTVLPFADDPKLTAYYVHELRLIAMESLRRNFLQTYDHANFFYQNPRFPWNTPEPMKATQGGLVEIPVSSYGPIGRVYHPSAVAPRPVHPSCSQPVGIYNVNTNVRDNFPRDFCYYNNPATHRVVGSEVYGQNQPPLAPIAKNQGSGDFNSNGVFGVTSSFGEYITRPYPRGDILVNALRDLKMERTETGGVNHSQMMYDWHTAACMVPNQQHRPTYQHRYTYNPTFRNPGVPPRTFRYNSTEQTHGVHSMGQYPPNPSFQRSQIVSAQCLPESWYRKSNDAAEPITSIFDCWSVDNGIIAAEQGPDDIPTGENEDSELSEDSIEIDDDGVENENESSDEVDSKVTEADHPPIIEINSSRYRSYKGLKSTKTIPLPTKGEKLNYLCVFCKGNDEKPEIFKSHPIRVNGAVTCPYLRAHVCKLCKATGDSAHTIKYCPKNTRGFFAMKAMDKAKKLLKLNKERGGGDAQNVSVQTGNFPTSDSEDFHSPEDRALEIAASYDFNNNYSGKVFTVKSRSTRKVPQALTVRRRHLRTRASRRNKRAIKRRAAAAAADAGSEAK